jgi:hypothetical protein
MPPPVYFNTPAAPPPIPMYSYGPTYPYVPTYPYYPQGSSCYYPPYQNTTMPPPTVWNSQPPPMEQPQARIIQHGPYNQSLIFRQSVTNIISSDDESEEDEAEAEVAESDVVEGDAQNEEQQSEPIQPDEQLERERYGEDFNDQQSEPEFGDGIEFADNEQIGVVDLNAEDFLATHPDEVEIEQVQPGVLAGPDPFEFVEGAAEVERNPMELPDSNISYDMPERIIVGRPNLLIAGVQLAEVVRNERPAYHRDSRPGERFYPVVNEAAVGMFPSLMFDPTLMKIALRLSDSGFTKVSAGISPTICGYQLRFDAIPRPLVVRIRNLTMDNNRCKMYINQYHIWRTEIFYGPILQLAEFIELHLHGEYDNLRLPEDPSNESMVKTDGLPNQPNVVLATSAFLRSLRKVLCWIDLHLRMYPGKVSPSRREVQGFVGADIYIEALKQICSDKPDIMFIIQAMNHFNARSLTEFFESNVRLIISDTQTRLYRLAIGYKTALVYFEDRIAQKLPGANKWSARYCTQVTEEVRKMLGSTIFHTIMGHNGPIDEITDLPLDQMVCGVIDGICRGRAKNAGVRQCLECGMPASQLTGVFRMLEEDENRCGHIFCIKCCETCYDELPRCPLCMKSVQRPIPEEAEIDAE